MARHLILSHDVIVGARCGGRVGGGGASTIHITGDQTVHLYPPTEGEDEVSHGRNIELLRAEWGKQKPRAEVVKELLTHTFSNRFDAYVNKHEPLSLLEYLAEFPMLKKANYVC